MSDQISRSAAIMHFVKVSKNYECGLFTLGELTKELWMVPSVRSGKTSVRCGYLGCVKNSEGVCSKNEIHLDERVDDIYIGCPDAEWEDQDED